MKSIAPLTILVAVMAVIASDTPPRFEGTTRSGDGLATRLTTASGYRYRLQSSTNLVTWREIQILAGTGAPVDVFAPGTKPREFLRAELISGLAPANIAQKIITFTVTAATPPLGRGTSYLVTGQATTNRIYLNLPEVGDSSSGTYTYDRTGANSAIAWFWDSMIFPDVIRGADLQFATASSGTFTLFFWQMPGTATGSFVLQGWQP